MKTGIRYNGYLGGEDIFTFMVECGTDEELHLANAVLGQLHRECCKNVWFEPISGRSGPNKLQVIMTSKKTVKVEDLEKLSQQFEEILGRLAKISKVYELTLKPAS